MIDFFNIEEKTIYLLKDLSPDNPYPFESREMSEYLLYSPRMKQIFTRLKKMASSLHVPLLIVGKTGSGKELVAQFLHYEVDRNQGPFVAVNCTNMNKDMFESELFGYEKGAFTGAHVSGHDGYLRQAGKGTLFLDEISEIDLDMQAKLLRVLEEGAYYRLGANKKEQVNARLVFASNRNLKEMVNRGSLREDLYYRLNVVAVEVPPLNERKEEIMPLAGFFIERCNQAFQKEVQCIEGKLLSFFLNYDWPGNIRELKNLITQMMIFIEGDTLRFSHLQVKDEIDRWQTQHMQDKFLAGKRSREKIIRDLIQEPFDLETFTMEVVRRTLRKFGGNKTQTARFLGLKREQLYNRYKADE